MTNSYGWKNLSKSYIISNIYIPQHTYDTCHSSRMLVCEQILHQPINVVITYTEHINWMGRNTNLNMKRNIGGLDSILRRPWRETYFRCKDFCVNFLFCSLSIKTNWIWKGLGFFFLIFSAAPSLSPQKEKLALFLA